MSKNLYITATEKASGKSIVALGLMEMLCRSISKVGFFRPIIDKNKSNQKDADIELEETAKTTMSDKLLWEKELLGLYVSGHPLESFKHKLENREINIKKIKETGKEKQSVVIGGILEDIRSVLTKKGEKMYFLKLADLTDSIDTVAFPKILAEFEDLIVKENCVVIKGTVSVRNGEKSILIDKIKLME